MKRTFKFDEEWKAAIGMLPQKTQRHLQRVIRCGTYHESCSGI